MHICLYQCSNTVTYRYIYHLFYLPVSRSQYMQIKFVCNQVQAMNICLYQCSNTYRYIMIHIPTTISVCISDQIIVQIQASKTCRNLNKSSSILIRRKDLLRDLGNTLPPRRWEARSAASAGGRHLLRRRAAAAAAGGEAACSGGGGGDDDALTVAAAGQRPHRE